MKQLFTEKLKQRLKERWNLTDEEAYEIKNNDHPDTLVEIPDGVKVYHPLIGFCRMNEVREAISKQAIVFSNGCWRMPVEKFMDFSLKTEGKVAWKATDQHKQWRQRFKVLSQLDIERQKDLI